MVGLAPTARLRFDAANMIDRWGRDAVIRSTNGAPDVPVRVYVSPYMPNEHRGRELDPLDRKAMISPTDQNGNAVAEPSPDQNVLVLWQVDSTGATVQPLTEDVVLSIVAQADRIESNGNILYWDLQVRR